MTYDYDSIAFHPCLTYETFPCYLNDVRSVLFFNPLAAWCKMKHAQGEKEVIQRYRTNSLLKWKDYKEICNAL